MENNYLVIFCSHVDSEQKKEVVIETLKELRDEFIDVCFSTHSLQYLDEISQHVKFTIYDSNNEYVLKNDYLSNTDLIGEDFFNFGISSYNKGESFGNVLDFNPGSPHSKSALILLKNGLVISKSNHYKWTIYLEYDIPSPEFGYKKFFEDRISLLKDSNKKCYYYNNDWNDDQFRFLWGGFFIFDTNAVFGNKLMTETDWFSNRRSWIKTFKIGWFESVVEYILNSSFTTEEIINKPITEDCYKEWGISNYSELSRFKYEQTYYKNKNDSRKFFTVNLYPAKKEDRYVIVLFSYNSHPDYQINVKNLMIKNSESDILLVENLSVSNRGWYFQIVELEKNITGILELSCYIDNGLETITYNEELNLDHIENIHNKLRRIEFT